MRWVLLVGVLLLAHDARADNPPAEIRIVTLAPALTQMLFDLGLGEQIVGVSEFDPAVSEQRPNVGSYVDPNTERLVSIKPTHVLLMSTQSGVPPRLDELAQRGLFTLKTYPYPTDALAVGDVVMGLGTDLGKRDEAGALRDAMLQQLNRIRQDTARFERPRILLVFGTEPVWASGPGTVNDALLGYLNADNAAGNAATPAVTYDREALLRDAPEVILLLLPGARPLEDDDPRLAVFADLPIPAVSHGRIHLIADPRVLLPATHLPRIAEQMARAIHPGYDTQDDGPNDDDQPQE